MALDSPASFWPISLTSCISKLFERIILSYLLFIRESNSILSPSQAGFRSGRFTLDHILYLSQFISDEFNKPRPGSRTILCTVDFSKTFSSVWHPPFSINSFRLASHLALLLGLHLSFLIDVLAWFIKIKKVVHFESVEVFRKDLFLAQCFSLSSSMIFLFLCLLLDVALAHLDSLLPHDLVLWTDSSVPSLGKGSFSVLANCFLCGTKSTLFFSAGPLCSSFSAEVCAILHALCWSRQYQQVCHFLLFYYLTLVLSSPPCPLLHLSSYLKLCGKSGMNCPFLLLLYQTTMGPRTLVSTGERRS